MSEPRPTALILGGSGDIGRAIARRLGEMDYRLDLVGRSADRLSQAEEILGEGGHDVVTHTCDVTDEAAVQAVVREVAEHRGSIDVAINAAGITEPQPLARARRDSWQTTLDTNLLGAVHACKALLGVMRRQRSGYVIQLGSMGATDGRVAFAAYCASKAALRAMGDTLRKEAGRFGVRVTTIVPDRVATRLHGDDNPDKESMIRPEDVAEAVAMLVRLSPHAIVRELLIHNVDGNGERS